MSGLAERLAARVAGGALEAPFAASAAVFLERRAAELAKLELPDAVERGLARLLASSPEFARYLSIRPELLERLAAAGPDALRAQGASLETRLPSGWSDDLERFLDGLRVLRRDEMAFAACLDLGGLAAFEEVSHFLSLVAEGILGRALEGARKSLGTAGALDFAVLGMGKLAGRELTYHSDLDLIFLYGGDTEVVHEASRLAQRVIHYLSTPTGAGVAYAIDARLRPSGRKGTLVTSYDAYARYQEHEAQTWEHLALMRCRALAGDVSRAGALLGEIQGSIRARHESPWPAVAEMRERIAAERTAPGAEALAIKTGAGGIMDVDFLAKGALLESGKEPAVPLPAVQAMLAATVRGRRVEQLVEDYRFLRRVEARARWVSGRPSEALDPAPERLVLVAELVEPGLDADGLLGRLTALRARVAECCERVLRAGTIGALGD